MTAETAANQTLSEKVKIYVSDMTEQRRELAIDLTPQAPKAEFWLHLVRTAGREYASAQLEVRDLEEKLDKARTRYIEAQEAHHEATEGLIDYAHTWEQS
jgi:hypothetical protein